MRINISFYYKVQIVNHPGGWCSLKVFNFHDDLIIGNIISPCSVCYDYRQAHITFSSLEGKTFLVEKEKLDRDTFSTLYQHWLNNLLSREKCV